MSRKAIRELKGAIERSQRAEEAEKKRRKEAEKKLKWAEDTIRQRDEGRLRVERENEAMKRELKKQTEILNNLSASPSTNETLMKIKDLKG